jgi:hypothetical protein
VTRQTAADGDPDREARSASESTVAPSITARHDDSTVPRQSRSRGNDGDDASSRQMIVVGAGTSIDTGEYTVSFSTSSDAEYIPFSEVDDLSTINVFNAVVLVESPGETFEMAILDTSSMQALHATGTEECREMTRELQSHLEDDVGFPSGYARNHVEALVNRREGFHVTEEYFVWFDDQQSSGESDVELPAGATGGAGGDETATFPNVNEQDVANEAFFFMKLGGFQVHIASALYALYTTAQATGNTLAIGVSGGIAPFIGGGGVGAGYAFFPSGGVGIYGGGNVDFGVQMSAGVNLDFTAVFGGIDTFTGEVLTTSVTIGPVSGTAFHEVEWEDGLKTPGEVVGISFAGGLSLGLEILASGQETTTVL